MDKCLSRARRYSIGRGVSPHEAVSYQNGPMLGRLYMGRDRGGQGQLKSCTSPGGAGGPQVAAMRLNDRPTDG
jgi:hypothetical protein